MILGCSKGSRQKKPDRTPGSPSLDLKDKFHFVSQTIAAAWGLGPGVERRGRVRRGVGLVYHQQRRQTRRLAHRQPRRTRAEERGTNTVIV